KPPFFTADESGLAPGPSGTWRWRWFGVEQQWAGVDFVLVIRPALLCEFGPELDHFVCLREEIETDLIMIDDKARRGSAVLSKPLPGAQRLLFSRRAVTSGSSAGTTQHTRQQEET